MPGSAWTAILCNDRCNEFTECRFFLLGKSGEAGKCKIYKAGCTSSSNTDWD